MKEFKSKFLKLITAITPNILMPVVYAAGTAVDIQGDDGTLGAILGEIISVLAWIAVVICIFKVIQIGIMFLMNASGKSKAKEALLPWLIGVAICATFATLGPAIMDLFYTDKGVFAR